MSTTIRIEALDGTCETSSETFSRLQTPWIREKDGRCYIGRRKIELQYILDIVRDCSQELSEIQYLESLFLFGILLATKQPDPVALLNIGGTFFHLRVAVANRIPYLESFLRWHVTGTEDNSSMIDLSSILIDRNPDKFQVLLTFVEVYGAPSLNLSKIKNEASFFGVYYDPGICFLCRKCQADDELGPLCAHEHKACSDCYSADHCSVCLQTVSQSIDEATDTTKSHDSFLSFPQPSTSIGLMALIAKGTPDVYLTDSYGTQNSVHRTSRRRVTNSSFTYITQHFHKNESRAWELILSKNCDMIGDSWLYVDLDVREDDLPRDLWSLCRIVDLLQISIGGFVIETITHPVMYVLTRIGEQACPLIEPIHGTKTRLIFALNCFWWKMMGTKLRLVGLKYHDVKITLKLSGYTATSVRLISTSWYLDTVERASVAQCAAEDLLVMHHSAAFKISATGETDSIHCQDLSGAFDHPVKDMILVVRPKTPAYACHTGPVRLIDVLVNDHVHLSLDGLFSRKILANHLYDVDVPADEFIYFLPFDTRVKRRDFAHSNIANSTINLSRIAYFKLKLIMSPGEYDCYLIARHVNIMRYCNGMAAIAYQ